MSDQGELNELNLVLQTVINEYIPSQLLRDVNEKEAGKLSGLEMIQYYLDNSNNKLKKYGTAEQLLSNLIIYFNFPLRRNRYPVLQKYLNRKPPCKYRSLNGQELCCKQDIVHYLLSTLKFTDQEPELEKCVRKHEERLRGCYEFVRYNKNLFDAFRSKPSEIYAPNTSEHLILRVVEKEFQVLERFVSSFPEFFLPHSEMKGQDVTVVVRIFDGGDEKFVMESELYNAINTKHPDREPLKCQDKDGYLRAIEMRDVYKEYRDDITGIDFIPWEVILAKHTAVPIVTPTGDHCILANQAFYHITRRTFSLQMFQKVKRNMVNKYFSFLSKYFTTDMKYRYFIKLDLLETIQEEHDEFWKAFEGKPAKSVRDIGPNGFTAEDLKKELKYLGITQIFPEICNNARGIYANITLIKPTNALTQCDFIDLLEDCQLSVLFGRFRYLRDFSHYQRFCVPESIMTCALCLEEKDKKAAEAEAKKSETRSEFEPIEKLVTAINGLSLPKPHELDELNTIPKVEILDENGSELNQLEPTADVEYCPKCESPHRLECRCFGITVEKLKAKKEELEMLTSEVYMLRNTAMTNAEQIQALKTYFEETKGVEMSKKVQLEQMNQDLKWAKERANRVDQLENEVEHLKKRTSETMKKKQDEIERIQRIQSQITKENKKEVEQLKRSAIKSAEQLKALTTRLSEKETVEAELNRTNEELTEKIRKLEREASRNHHLETEIEEKNRIILELQESRNQQVAEQEKAKEELHSEISMMSIQFNRILNKLVPSTPQDSALLISLQKARDKIRDDSPLKLAKEMVEKLIILSTRSEIHQMARYEYEQYEGKVCVYVQELEVSIDKLNDKSCMTTPPLPSQFPSFSDRFMNEYWMEINKSRNEVVDNECLICFFEMTHEMDTLKCEECKKVIHMECASKWLKIHRSCPHCRREQLDPNEFPALQ